MIINWKQPNIIFYFFFINTNTPTITTVSLIMLFDLYAGRIQAHSYREKKKLKETWEISTARNEFR